MFSCMYSTHCAWILCKSKSNLISKSLPNIYDNINAVQHFLLQVFNILTYGGFNLKPEVTCM